jgi:RNA polymerase sigma-70 factor (ECF subfamily)
MVGWMFPATQWTELARATLHGDAAGRAALESLCRAYWEPVRRAILAKGWERDDAEDLAQGFFLDFMERGVLNRADRERGKFRTFLQVVLDHWLVDEWRRRHAERRGAGVDALSWEALRDMEQLESNNIGRLVIYLRDSVIIF